MANTNQQRLRGVISTIIGKMKRKAPLTPDEEALVRKMPSKTFKPDVDTYTGRHRNYSSNPRAKSRQGDGKQEG
jgi:hypothetical protein